MLAINRLNECLRLVHEFVLNVIGEIRARFCLDIK